MKKNIGRRFVGREEELADFADILNDPYGERRIKYIWGPGGIGKTWLAYKMLAQTSGEGILNLQLIDMYSPNVRHTEGLMDEVIKRLKDCEGIDSKVYAGYEEVQQSLINARGSGEYSPQGVNALLRQLESAFRKCMESITTHHTLVLALDTFEHVRNFPVGRWILDEKGLQMPGLVCIIAGRPDPLNPPEIQLSGLTDEEVLQFYYAYTHSQEHKLASKHFLEQLNAKVNGNPLLLGLAVFWRDSDELGTELLNTTSKSDFKKRIVWALRSTEGSGPRNLGNIHLDEPMYQTLVCMAYLNRRFNKFFLNKLVENRYVRLSGTDVERIWQELQKDHLFFVKSRPEGEVQLHDELAELFKEYLLSDVFDEIEGGFNTKWDKFVGDIVNWYDELIAQAPDNTIRAIYQVEKLRYLLQVDAPKIRRKPDTSSARRLLQASGRENSDILHQLLLDEVNDDFLNLFSDRERYELVVLLAQLAMRINQVSKSQYLWEKAVGIAQDMKDPCAEIEALVGPNTWQSEPDYCLSLLNRARILSEKDCPEKLPRVLYGLGFAYRRKNNMVEAINFYGKARQAAYTQKDEEIKSIIKNDMGHIYSLMGDYGKAAANIKEARQQRTEHLAALRLKREEYLSSGIPTDRIDDDIRQAAWMTGLSYNTLGTMERFMGDMPKAIEYYNEALGYFAEARNLYWKMICLISRGEAERRYAMIKHQAGLVDSTQNLDRAAYDDISESINIADGYGFFETKDLIKRRMGRLFHDRGQRSHDIEEKTQNFRTALEYFEEALKIAQDTGDVLEELENLTEIAFLADDMLQLHFLNRDSSKSSLLGRGELRQLEGYIQRLEEGLARHAFDSDRVYQYDVFQHLLEIEKGAFYYVQKDYTTALEFYLKGFTGLASDPGYGSARFVQHSGHLIQQIMNLTDSKCKINWILAFNNKWNEVSPGSNGKKLTDAKVVADLLYGIFVKMDSLIYEAGLEESFML